MEKLRAPLICLGFLLLVSHATAEMPKYQPKVFAEALYHCARASIAANPDRNEIFSYADDFLFLLNIQGYHGQQKNMAEGNELPLFRLLTRNGLYYFPLTRKGAKKPGAGYFDLAKFYVLEFQHPENHETFCVRYEYDYGKDEAVTRPGECTAEERRQSGYHKIEKFTAEEKPFRERACGPRTIDPKKPAVKVPCVTKQGGYYAFSDLIQDNTSEDFQRIARRGFGEIDRLFEEKPKHWRADALSKVLELGRMFDRMREFNCRTDVCQPPALDMEFELRYARQAPRNWYNKLAAARKRLDLSTPKAADFFACAPAAPASAPQPAAPASSAVTGTPAKPGE